MTEGRNEIIITCIFDVPCDFVWKAWTKPEQVMRWWGPKIFTAPSCKIDFRVGGKYLFCMRSESGQEVWRKGIWSTGVYKEIVPMKRIVFTDCFADEDGNVVPATYYGMEGFPLELEVTLTFEEVEGNKTKMTLLHKGLPEKVREECRTGWNESFDKLEKIFKKGRVDMQTKTSLIKKEYRSVTPTLVIRGARQAIEFYKKAFGAEVRFLQDRPDGKVMHAEIRIGDSVIMIGDECAPHKGHEIDCVRSPADLGGTTTSLYFYVNNADEVFNKAVKSGATVSMPIADMFWGDRMGVLKDPFGHFWSIATHTKDVNPEEMKQGMEKFFSQQAA